MLICPYGFKQLKLILVNIMFDAPMGRFQLEFIYFVAFFFTVLPFNTTIEREDDKKGNED